MAKLRDIVTEAFLDGFTGAGLFGKLRRPGAPTEYVDPRGIAELQASGEFDAMLRRYKGATFAEGATPVPQGGAKGDSFQERHAVNRR
jgi:hypothetical protein